MAASMSSPRHLLENSADVVQAADILIDERTKQSAAAQLATLLQLHQRGSEPGISDQVLRSHCPALLHQAAHYCNPTLSTLQPCTCHWSGPPVRMWPDAALSEVSAHLRCQTDLNRHDVSGWSPQVQPLRPRADCVLSSRVQWTHPQHLQVMLLLPEHLLLLLLSRLPLVHTLCYLPSTFHTLALRAHHPSIDSHNSLPLAVLPPRSLLPALAAACTLTTLQDFSLAESTFPTELGGFSDLLPQLPRLTALSLQNCGLTADVAAALAAALPALPKLQTLDLSRNLVTDKTMEHLTEALAGCTTLHSLNMSHLASTTRTYACMIPLAVHTVHAVAHLQQLTALLLGLRRAASSQTHVPIRGFATAFLDLVHAVRILPRLSLLELCICGVVLSEAEAEVAAGVLAGMTQLRQLAWALPFVERPRGTGTPGRDPRGRGLPSQAGKLGRALGRSVQLTCLRLQCCCMDATAFQESVLPHLAGLSGLRELQLDAEQGGGLCGSDPCALAGLLPLMPRLSKLHRLAGPRRVVARMMGAGQQLPLALATAVAAAPALLEVRVPVFATGAGLGPLAAALRGATHLRKLRIDLYVKCVTAVHFLDAAVPLLPHVCSLHICAAREWPSLDPLLAASSALSNLQVLHLDCAQPCVAADVQRLLNCVPGMPRLRQFGLVLRLPNLIPSDAQIDVGPFCEGLGGLGGLTGLEWDSRGATEAAEHQRQVLLACGRLPGLRVLRMGCLQSGALPAFARVVPQLRLRELEVEVTDAAGGEAVRRALASLPHLRSVHVRLLQYRQGLSWLRATAAGMPGCHFVV